MNKKETSKTEERLPDEVFREDSRKEEEERQGVAKRASLAVFILVVLLLSLIHIFLRDAVRNLSNFENIVCLDTFF